MRIKISCKVHNKRHPETSPEEIVDNLGIKYDSEQYHAEDDSVVFYGVKLESLPDAPLPDYFEMMPECTEDRATGMAHDVRHPPALELKPQPAIRYVILRARYGAPSKEHDDWLTAAEYLTSLGVSWLATQVDSESGAQWFFGVDYLCVPVDLSDSFSFVNTPDKGIVWQYNANGSSRMAPNYCVLEATLPGILQRDGKTYTSPSEQMATLGIDYVAVQDDFTRAVQYFFGVDADMLPVNLPSNMQRLDEESEGVVWNFLKDGSPVAIASPAYPDVEKMINKGMDEIVDDLLGTNDDGSPRHASGKDTNPKDAVGTMKWRQYCTVPTTIVWELGVAMLEGARKYGRHNYRVSDVRASVYVDAAKGHIDCYWEGEDIDEDSGLHHITKAMASLAVLRDAMIQRRCIDDRPPETDVKGFAARMQVVVEMIFRKYPDAVPAYLEGDQYPKGPSGTGQSLPTVEGGRR